MSSWAAPAINTLALARVEALMLLGRQFPPPLSQVRGSNRGVIFDFLSNANKNRTG